MGEVEQIFYRRARVVRRYQPKIEVKKMNESDEITGNPSKEGRLKGSHGKYLEAIKDVITYSDGFINLIFLFNWKF